VRGRVILGSPYPGSCIVEVASTTARRWLLQDAEAEICHLPYQINTDPFQVDPSGFGTLEEPDAVA
jgi:hypothetical protein